MTDKDGNANAGSGWTDHEKLVYIVGLLEASSTKLNYAGAPRVSNRTEVACKLMVSRLRQMVKPELDALKAEQGLLDPNAPPPKASTPRKRKTKATDGEDGDDATPKKRGRGRPKKNGDATTLLDGPEDSPVKFKKELCDGRSEGEDDDLVL